MAKKSTMKRLISVAGILFFTLFCSVKAQTSDSLQIGQQTVANADNGSNSGAVKEMTRRTFIKEVYDYRRKSTPWLFKGSKPAVIVLYANWCSPCRQMTPIVAQLASEYADRVKFYRVNIDSEKELSEYFHASYIPLFIFISLNDTPEQISGSMSRETLKGHIDAILPEDK